MHPAHPSVTPSPLPDNAASEALHRIDRSRRTVTAWIAGAGTLEGILLVAFILLADFGNRTHLLLLIAALLVYGTLALGLLALGAYVRTCSLRVIDAIDLGRPAEREPAR